MQQYIFVWFFSFWKKPGVLGILLLKVFLLFYVQIKCSRKNLPFLVQLMTIKKIYKISRVKPRSLRMQMIIFFFKLAIPRSILLLLLFCKLERYYRSNLPVHVLSKTRLSRSTNFSIFFKRMLRIFLPANIFHKRFWNVNIAACKLMKLNSSYDSSCEFATFCPKF